MENQGDIFLSGEGDEWFSRNSAKLVNSNSKQIDLLEIESVLNPFKNDSFFSVGKSQVGFGGWHDNIGIVMYDPVGTFAFI